MGVYEIPNIEHCTVEPIGNPAIMYRIRTNEGWVIHLPSYADNEYSTAIALLASDDFSVVEILPISSLEGDYEINDETTPPEIM
jgi:hypothetical protein